MRLGTPVTAQCVLAMTKLMVGRARIASGDFAGAEPPRSQGWRRGTHRRWARRVAHRMWDMKVNRPRGAVIIRRFENPSSLVDSETSAGLLTGHSGAHRTRHNSTRMNVDVHRNLISLVIPLDQDSGQP